MKRKTIKNIKTQMKGLQFGKFKAGMLLQGNKEGKYQ